MFAVSALSGAVIGCGVSDDSKDGGPPYAPKEALSTFDLADGFRIELFAAEPLVEDPIDMAVDAAGRIYVVELHGYPSDESGSSQIKLLRDTDGDGLPDQSTVFAEGLRMPKGIMPWKDGLLVTDAPDVLYVEDTDGDGRADERNVILTGFDNDNPQLGVNNPVYGLDNWIYVAHMSGSDSVRFAARPGRVYDVSGRNVRLRPKAHELEALAASSQFGYTFDRWGRHLFNSNSNHIYQQVLAGRYLERNPYLLVSSTTEVISDHGAAAKVYPITTNPEYQLFTDAGGFTAASGLTSYLGGLFPSEYQNVAFVGAPVHNLVHVDKLSESGAALTASRMQEERAFLASTDSWFRPVNFYVGPDGALYVIDYYRDIIEQPKYLSDEVLASKDIYAGADRGRIYRIVPEGTEAPSWLNNLPLKDASVEQLVQALERENIWWRRTAQRLLVHRGDTAAVKPLQRLVRESPVAEARLHALWTLEGLDALEPGLITQALKDEAAGVRENAIRLAERHLEQTPALAEQLVAVGVDPDPSVRYQLLCTLGSVETKPARVLRRKLLFENVESTWFQLAALSASGVQPRSLYELAIAQLTGKETEARQAFFQRVAAMIGATQKTEAERQILRVVTDTAAGAAWWRAASLMGLVEGMQQQGETPAAALKKELGRLTGSFFEMGEPMRTAVLKTLTAVDLPPGAQQGTAVRKAAQVAADQQEEPDLRVDAVRLLELSDPSAYVNLLEKLINPREPAIVQQAAIRALGQLEGAEVAKMLISQWSEMTPDVRRQAIDVFMEGPERIRLLLNAMESGTIQPSMIGRQRVKALMLIDDPMLRKKARALLTEQQNQRKGIVDRYREALVAEGSVGDGRQVYQRVCARCHLIGSQGGAAFGPDLTTIKNRSREWLLANILLPNKSIAEGYELWTVTRKNGETASGVITSETPTSVTLRTAGGEAVTIPRGDVQSLLASKASAMPIGLEAQISKAEMADLLTFLRQSQQ